MSWLKQLLGIRELTHEEMLLDSLTNARRWLACSRSIPDHERRAVDNLIGRIDAQKQRLAKEWGA